MFTQRSHADENFFEMMRQGMENTPLFRNKQLFFQYVALLYLGGMRRIEPFLKPITIQKIKDDEGNLFVKITHLNAKHFSGTRLRCICGSELGSIRKFKAHQVETGHSGYANMGTRKTLSSIFLLFGVHERALVDYVLNGKQMATIDFTPLLPLSVQHTFVDNSPTDIDKLESKLSGITQKFKMFKMSITDGATTKEGESIVPHMLRHLRAFDLIANHGVSLPLAQRLLGWQSSDLAMRYADISSHISDTETFQLWKPVIKQS